MPSAQGMLFLAVVVLAGGALGYVLISNRWRRAYGALFAAHVFAALGLFVMLQSRSQMDGLVQAIFLVGFVLPSLVGMILGAGLGWLQLRRAAKR